MRKIKIVADSSADLFKLWGCDFAYAPMKVISREREFIDDELLDVDEMVQYFYQYKGQSKSSCPNAQEWLEAFGDCDDILCFTITSALSGSYNAACAAKKIYESEHKGKRVFVLDTLTAGPEIRLMIEKAESDIAKGLAFEELCHEMTEYKNRTGLSFMLKSLKNFANNGRVSPTVARVAGLLGICIVGKAGEEGTLEPLHKCRGEAKSLEKIVADMKEHGYEGGKARITHCQNAPLANRLKQLIEEEFASADVTVDLPRGLCSFYIERGGVLIGYEKE